MLLSDRVALVAGVGPGTGRAIALALAREGADLVLACRRAEVAQAVGREVEAAGRRALCVAGDLTQAADRERMLSAAEQLGGLDVLVNNAFAIGQPGSAESGPIEKWKAAFEVNVFGVMQLCQGAVSLMKKRGRGSIVMINSLAARQPTDHMAGYGASKAALMAAARSLAADVGRHGIRVNSVVPSHIDGPNLEIYFRLEAERQGVSRDEVYRQTAELGVLDHVSTCDEVAEVVVFFASDMASAVTGQTLDVSCGQWFG